MFSALVNVNRNAPGMSWIGTNSDGSQAANSTIHSSTITQLVCGTNCVIATVSVSNVGARTVMLTANAATSIIHETYVVNMWF